MFDIVEEKKKQKWWVNKRHLELEEKVIIIVYLFKL